MVVVFPDVVCSIEKQFNIFSFHTIFESKAIILKVIVYTTLNNMNIIYFDTQKGKYL